MGALGAILAQFALAFLREWLARSDLKRAERAELVAEGLATFYALDQAALAVLVERSGHPDLAHVLRVRGDGPRGGLATFTPTGPSPGEPPEPQPGP